MWNLVKTELLCFWVDILQNCSLFTPSREHMSHFSGSYTPVLMTTKTCDNNQILFYYPTDSSYDAHKHNFFIRWRSSVVTAVPILIIGILIGVLIGYLIFKKSDVWANKFCRALRDCVCRWCWLPTAALWSLIIINHIIIILLFVCGHVGAVHNYH